MKALFSLVSLLLVLAIVAVLARQALRASHPSSPGAGAAGASAPLAGSSQPTPAQFQHELSRTLDAGMATRASQAESAGEAP